MSTKTRNILNFLFKSIKKNLGFCIYTLIVLILVTVKLPVNIYGPGGFQNLDDKVDGEVYKTSGKLGVTYVSGYPGFIPFIIASWVNPNLDIIEKEELVYDHETLEDGVKRDRIYSDEATSTAIYVGYTKANVPVNITSTDVYVIFIEKDAKTDLKVGDKVVTFDGEEINSLDTLDKLASNRKENTQVEIEVLRDGKKKKCYGIYRNEDGKNIIGFVSKQVNNYKNDPDVKYKSKKNELGSSGGLMTALYIYNSLIEEDISYGKMIAGTGTISYDGKVGEIAGVKYKIIGAYKKGARIFIVPSENYKEAKAVVKDRGYDMTLIEAKTFDGVLESLKDLKDK